MVLLIVLLLILGFRVVLLILAGTLVAAFFMGIAGFIHSKTSLNRGFCLLISVLLVLGITIGLSFVLAPSISEQVEALKTQLPEASDKAMSQLEDSSFGSFLIEQVESLDLEPKGSQITSFFGSLGGILSTIYIVLFLGMFFMLSPQIYLDGFVSLFPKKRRSRAREVLVTMGSTLQSWLLGKLISMLIVGVLTGIGLAILGIPLVLSLALFAALISFIPNFGPLLALLPAVLLAFMDSPTTALYVVILYIAIQAVESNLLTPMIQKKMISLPMAMILIAQVVLGLFTGILGIILAVPLVAVIIVLIRMVYIEDILQDKTIQ